MSPVQGNFVALFLSRSIMKIVHVFVDGDCVLCHVVGKAVSVGCSGGRGKEQSRSAAVAVPSNERTSFLSQ